MHKNKTLYTNNNFRSKSAYRLNKQLVQKERSTTNMTFCISFINEINEKLKIIYKLP